MSDSDHRGYNEDEEAIVLMAGGREVGKFQQMNEQDARAIARALLPQHNADDRIDAGARQKLEAQTPAASLRAAWL